MLSAAWADPVSESLHGMRHYVVRRHRPGAMGLYRAYDDHFLLAGRLEGGGLSSFVRIYSDPSALTGMTPGKDADCCEIPLPHVHNRKAVRIAPVVTLRAAVARPRQGRLNRLIYETRQQEGAQRMRDGAELRQEEPAGWHASADSAAAGAAHGARGSRTTHARITRNVRPKTPPRRTAPRLLQLPVDARPMMRATCALQGRAAHLAA